MPTGQKYSGKGEPTTQTETNGSTIEPTVKSDTSAAASADQADLNDTDLVDFDELRQEYNLDEVDVQMLTDLYRNGCSLEVIRGKAQRLHNIVFDNQTPFATEYPKLSDKEFVDHLTHGYDLTPDDALTIEGMVQKAVPRDMVERTAKRFQQHPTFGNVINRLLDLNPKEEVKPTPARKPAGDLSAHLDILVNARFGTSHANVLIFALTEYQQSRLKEAMASLAEGLYDDAANDLSDSECAGTMLMELALSLSKLADRNYWASTGEMPQGKSKPSNVFESYAKHYFGFSDERIQQHVKENY